MKSVKANRLIEVRFSTCCGISELMHEHRLRELIFTMGENGVFTMDPVFMDGTSSNDVEFSILNDIEGGEVFESTFPLSTTN